MRLIYNFAGALTQFAAIWHLWRNDLLRFFPCLAFHLAANAVWLLISSFALRNSREYGLVWMAFAVITVCSLVAAFLETVSRSLEHYPGLSSRGVLGAFGVIAAVSAILGALEPIYKPLNLLFVVQRVSGLAVAMGAIGLVAVLNYLDPRRRPNVVRHERIMAAMAGTTAWAAWLSNHQHVEAGTNLLYAGSILFPALWIWGLRPDGETDPRPPSDPAGRQQARAATDQLRKYYDE